MRSSWILAGIMVIVLATRLFPAQRVLFNVDEASNSLVAQAILRGQLPYADIVDQQFPLAYYFYALIFAVFGGKDILVLRFTLAGLVLLSTFLLYVLGRRFLGRPAALWAALFFAVFSFTHHPTDFWALHTEWFLIVFSLLGMYALLAGLSLCRSSLVFLSGCLFSLAVLCKQVAVFDIMAVMLFLVDQRFARDRAVPSVFRAGMVFSAGVAVPIGLCFLYFFSRGAFEEMFFYTVRYNAQYYLADLGWLDVLNIVSRNLRVFFESNVLLVALFLAGACSARMRYRSPGDDVPGPKPFVLGLLLFWSLVTLWGASRNRPFLHYFIQVLPPACLLAGWGADRLWRLRVPTLSSSVHRAMAGFLGAVIVCGLVYPLGITFKRHYYAHLHAVDQKVGFLPKYIRENSSSGESIFVWGFAPEIYFLSDRRPASRFTVCHFLSGLIPFTNADWTKDTAYAVVPGAWEDLLADLRSAQPKFIIDTSPLDLMGYGKYPVRNFPALRDYLQMGYRLDPNYPYNQMQGQIRIYVRIGGAK